MTERQGVGRGLVAAVLLAVATLTPPPARPSGGATAPPERTLFVLLDAVPYSLLEELTDPRGEARLFADFARPVPLISTFPSSTSVATVGILEPMGVERSPGYEARFFDWEEREVRGGGMVSYFRIDFPWRGFFNWSGKGVVRSAFAALRPVRASIGRLDRAVEQFFDSSDREYFVYVETTDTAAHLKSPASLGDVFRSLDEALALARSRHPEAAYRVVLFSDHGISGGSPLANVFRPVCRALERDGFRLRKRLLEPGDVALTPFGLVSSFEVYTSVEDAAEVSSTLTGVDGIDLCVRRSQEGWVVQGPEGSAAFRRWQGADGLRWSYEPIDGDPLDYGAVARELEARAAAGPAREPGQPDDWWLEATAGHWYPDGLYRLARAFDLVENPASILCSLEPGYMYGLITTALGARLTQGPLEWTHGALHREASYGFVMTDDPAWEPYPVERFSRGLLPFLPAVAAPKPVLEAAGRKPDREPSR